MYNTCTYLLQRSAANKLWRAAMCTKIDVKSQTPNPKKIATDMIGPMDPVSNLRRFVFREGLNETELEKQYRLKRDETQQWNQTFWTEHNSRFYQEREDYLKKNLPSDKQTLTADEMSVFYKAFLDKNWKSHVAYNIEWYKRNFNLLQLAFKVEFYRIFSSKS